jgi:hypothetical protein
MSEPTPRRPPHAGDIPLGEWFGLSAKQGSRIFAALRLPGNEPGQAVLACEPRDPGSADGLAEASPVLASGARNQPALGAAHIPTRQRRGEWADSGPGSRGGRGMASRARPRAIIRRLPREGDYPEETGGDRETENACYVD